MNVVVLFQLHIFELILQASLVNFMLFSNISKILKFSFWKFWRKKLLISCLFALSALSSLKSYKAFRIARCKQSQLLKLWLNFDTKVIFKSTGTGFALHNSSLLTPLSVSPKKTQENSFLSASRQQSITTVLVYIFSSILSSSYANQKNSIIKGWKYRSTELLKAIFSSANNNKKADRLCMKLPSTSSIVTPQGDY